VETLSLPQNPWQSRAVSTPHSPFLTFDDGPTPGTTDKILDVLAEQGASAGFFVCGAFAERHPTLVARAASEGHLIGNHSWDHPLLTCLDTSEVERQLRDTNAIIESITGAPPRYFRPPYGAAGDEVFGVAASLQLETMLWSYSPDDWQCPGVDAIETRVIDHLEEGSIILLHDGCADDLSSGRASFDGLVSSRSQTVQALPRILDSITCRFPLRTHGRGASASR
jgi:peptidoglycan-N-acetylglucosamine deacetylase